MTDDQINEQINPVRWKGFSPEELQLIHRALYPVFDEADDDSREEDLINVLLTEIETFIDI